MQNEKLTKLTHQSKLSLKRSNSDSSQNNLDVKSNIDGQESCSIDQSSHKENDPCPSNVEDSLADFKSPKEKKSYKPILNKFKIDSEKVKRKIIKSKSKSRKSTSTDTKQPSIESSFFQPKTTSNQTELKESIPCPLCLKPFKDDEACTNHMKICATKNKVSFKQLLDARKLQDRQAEERKAMGLLAAPVLPEKKKGFRSKNFSTGDDPHLQLVLAMSESLYEAQQIEELEQAALLAGIPSECIKEMNNEDCKRTLQKFGFTTNKPATESNINKPRKKKLMGPTILQTRSKEDKDRVLTERIACILTGDDALTQVQQKRDNFSEEKEPTVLKSKILKEIEETCNRLWDRSRLTKTFNNFYVDGLKTHFFQTDQKLQSESLDIKHINNDDECNILCNISVEYEPVNFDIVDDLDKETKNNLVLSNMAELNSNTYETDLMKNIISNWGEILNDSTESDVIVFVKDDKHIYAHKLVFYVQCSNILLDIEPNDTLSHRRIKKKICWPDKDKLSALAFLEFIYCGTIKKYISVFDQDNLISEIQTLARLYKVKDLFAYIRNKQIEFKHMNEKESEKVINDVVNKSPKQSSLFMDVNESMNLCQDLISYGKDLSIHVQPTQVSHSLIKYNSDPTPIIPKSVPNNLNKSLSAQNFNDRRVTASPDLFESENEEETMYSLKTQMSNTTINNLNNTNLNILVDLINDDEKEDEEINQFDQNSDGHQINSQKTIVNLSRTPSPSEDLHEALTPKNRSPETVNNSKEESPNQVDMQIAEAITPKRISPVNQNIFQEDIVSAKISKAVIPDLNSPSIQNDFLKNITLRKEKKISNVANSNSDSSSKLNDCNVSNTKPQEIADDYDESIYTAVTPPKSEGMKVTLDKNNSEKLKTDLSIFLDKVKKENAKSLLDSDSEVDSPIIPDKPRNPFAKRHRDDSYAYLVNGGQKGSKKGISLLENQILEEENRVSDRADLPKQSKTTYLKKSQSLNQRQREVSNKSLCCASSVYKENTSKSSISNDEIEDVTPDEMDTSRYSTYKKKNKHDNSIAKYRKGLEEYPEINSLKQNSNSINESTEKQDSSRDSSNSKKVLLGGIKEMETKSVIEDITLVSDSDDDVSQINSSAFSTQCNKSNKNDSLPDIDKEKTQTKKLTHSTISNIQNDSTFPLDLINSEIEPAKVVNSTSLKEKSGSKVIDLSSESEEENIYNESTFSYSLAVESDNSLKNKKMGNKGSTSEKYKQMDLLNYSEKVNVDVDAEISKILESSPDFSVKTDNLTIDNISNQTKKDSNKKKSKSEKKVLDSNKDSNECEVITLSPLSIISSSERDEIDKDKQSDVSNKKRGKSKDNERKNRRSSKNFMEFDTIESACFDEIQFDDFFTKSGTPKSEEKNNRKSQQPQLENKDDRKSQRPKSENKDDRKSQRTTSENKSDRKSQGPKSSSHESSKKTLNIENSVSNAKACAKMNSVLSKSLTSLALSETSISSPILSQSKRKSRLSLDNASIKPSTSQRKLGKSNSPEKSLTALNLDKEDEKLDEDNPPISLYTTPKNKRKSSQKTTIDNNGVTPPLDYSTLGTPDLQKELKKFGVKSLNRTNAKLLLRHIYNETHQGVSIKKRASGTSDDEEPPPKKKNVNRGSKTTTSKEKTKSNSTKTSEDCPVIAEEMDYDDSDAPNNVDNPVSIKDVFYKLLHTNKDLYNKVLTYEPLSLDSLHLMLKQKGFKCKMNSLMDFLDEQCITFQVQNVKGNRIKKKKS